MNSNDNDAHNVTFSDFLSHCRFSKVPSDNPDSKIFPLYQFAKRIEVVVEKGQAIFIPAGWFHFVSSESVGDENGLNIALSYFVDFAGCPYCDIALDKKYSMKCKEYEERVSEKTFLKHKKASFPYLDKTFATSHNWPCFNWSRTSIQELFGANTSTYVNYSPDNLFVSNFLSYFDKIHTNGRYMKFSEFLEHSDPIENLYILQHPKEVIQNEAGLPKMLKGATQKKHAIWINKGGGIYSSLHYDNHDNILVQVSGSKRIILFPPSERDKLYLYNPYPTRFICKLKKSVTAAPFAPF